MKEYKNDFEKHFFKLMNSAVLGKAMKNMRRHGDIQLVTNEARRNYLRSERNYHKITFFFGKFISPRNYKTQIFMNKPVCLGLSILEISKIVTYEFWHDYVKPKYGEKAKLCYMDIDNFTVYAKIKYIYIDIAKNDLILQTKN